MSVKILEVEKIEAETTELFMAMFNERANELARFNPTVCPINATSALIYHESVEVADEQSCGRKCCDCTIYEWGKHCKLTGERRTGHEDACEFYSNDNKYLNMETIPQQ